MATMKTGVAWKSLTIPSCLPLTTDFFPSKNFKKNFLCSSNYTLLLDDDIREQYGYSNYGSEQNKIPMEKVFNDLVGHRLAMGFQMVVSKNNKDNNSSSSFMYDTSSISSFISRSSIKGYYKLSLGRIYHDLYYIVDQSNKTDYVKVEIYIPQQNKDKLNKTIEYKYRFQVPDSKTYDISYCDMSRKSIESIKWNLIDSYICIQGNGSLTPNQLEKCWRQRLYLVPLMYVQNSKLLGEQLNKPPPVNTLNNVLEFQNLTPAQIPASYFENQQPIRCDIYQRKSAEELKFTRDYYFIRFMEGLNKLNRADERKSYSKSTIAYLEAHNYNLNNCFTDMCLAVTGIMSSISSAQTYSSNNSNNNNISNNLITQSTRSQLASSVPPISSKQLQFERLPSPKKQLFPLVSLYVNLINSDSKSNQSATSDYSSFRSTSNQNDNNNTTLLSSSSTSSLLSSTTATSITNMQNDANKLKTDILNILNNDYKVHMLNNQTGIPFIQNKKDIPLNCFISAEAVWWCIEHINEIENEGDAILFLQICSDFDIIRHISNQQKIFIHGFYLYYIITNENRNHHLFTKDYCEVGFCHIDTGTESEMGNNLIHVNNLPAESAHTLPVTLNDMFSSYLNLFNKFSKTDFNNTTPESIMKLVNVDVDPNHKSNRVEWASAIYRSHYHQLCACKFSSIIIILHYY